jgi:hypothetical protein
MHPAVPDQKRPEVVRQVKLEAVLELADEFLRRSRVAFAKCESKSP